MSTGPLSEIEIVEILLSAYRQGAFPMADDSDGRIHFYSADPRGVMPLTEDDGLHVPATVEREIRRGRFVVTADLSFERVMRSCAEPRSEDDGRWITPELVRWYAALFHAGHAHSIEARRPDPRTGELVLVGGIYGVSIGAAFFGESMFCVPRARLETDERHPLDGSNASSVCLVALTRHLQACGYRLFDTQMTTAHTSRFGALEIPASDYEARLAEAIDLPDAWRPFP